LPAEENGDPAGALAPSRGRTYQAWSGAGSSCAQPALPTYILNKEVDMPEQEVHWFLTVDRCKQGKRGVFTDNQGKGYWKDDSPHTMDEMFEILGPFVLVLSPKSLPITLEEMNQVTDWYSLGEYSDQYGYAVIPEDVLKAVEARAAA
jgi:hypothetical protein